MESSEHQHWSEELIRLNVLYHKALKFGQDERAKEVFDEMYALVLNKYNHYCKLSRRFQEIVDGTTNPDIKKSIGNVVQICRDAAEKLVEPLDELVSVSLMLYDDKL